MMCRSEYEDNPVNVATLFTELAEFLSEEQEFKSRSKNIN